MDINIMKGNLGEKDYLREQKQEERVTLKLIFSKQGVQARNEYIWLIIGFSNRSLWPL